jgi:hypothetical protein
MKRVLCLCEGILQFFIALGALTCGLLLMLRPDGALMHMPVSMLKGSPFSDFLVPGIILFTVNGVGNAFAGVLSFRASKLSGFSGIFFGVGLMIWIFVQVSMIGGGHWLQYSYFFLGLAQTLLGIAIRDMERRGCM